MNIKTILFIISVFTIEFNSIAQIDTYYSKKIQEIENCILENKNDKALKLSSALLIKYPFKADIYLYKGLAFENLNKIDSAQLSYEKVLDIQSTKIEAIYNLGVIHFNRAIDTRLIKKEQELYNKELINAQRCFEHVFLVERTKELESTLKTIYKLRNVSIYRIDSLLSEDYQISLNDQSLMIFHEEIQLAEYKGGEKEMYKFIDEHLEYPVSAKRNGYSGRVFISFVVEKDGKVSNVKIMKGIDRECDLSAKKVVNEMPNWIPGYDINNNPIRCRFRMPIKFTLTH